jgi:hypothetical protein
MSFDRDNKTLAARVDTGFNRKPMNPFLRTRFVWCCWSAILALIFSAAAWFGAPATYESRPVSLAHQFINHDCQQCHDQSFATLHRFNPFSHATSTSNDACLKCHAGAVHHGQARGLASDLKGEIENCSSCHREHRGKMELARVADAYCVACHAELKTNHDGVSLASTNFAAQINSWSAHPEFALFRPTNDPLTPGKDHEIHAIVAKAIAEPKADSTQVERQLSESQRAADKLFAEKHPTGAWVDKTRLKFNHWAHLKGPIPIDHRERPNETEVLRCDSCHQPDAARRYMLPVNHDLHCGRCHKNQLRPDMPVKFDTADTIGVPAEATLASVDQFNNQPVPHRTPEMVRGVLRDRLTRFSKEHKATAQARLKGTIAPDDRPLPGRRPVVPPDEDELLRLVDGLMDVMQSKLFTGSGGCFYCHEPADGPKMKNTPADAQLAEVKQPARWFPHSVFNHDSHRFMSCNQCHEDVNLSTQTSHILLPSRETCMKCHQQNSLFATKVSHAARTDCAECHRFHHRDEKQTDGSWKHESLDGKLNRDLGALKTSARPMPTGTAAP